MGARVLSEVGADDDEDLRSRDNQGLSRLRPVAGTSLRLLDTNRTVQLSAALEYQQIDTWWLSGVLASAGTHRFELPPSTVQATSTRRPQRTLGC